MSLADTLSLRGDCYGCTDTHEPYMIQEINDLRVGIWAGGPRDEPGSKRMSGSSA
jgi:hypothetical protein